MLEAVPKQWWIGVVAAAGVVGGCHSHVTPFVNDPSVIQLRHASAGEEAVGNFAGRIPCDGCDKIKILLSLFRNGADHSPARYQLERVGEDGNARITTRDTWTQTTGRPGHPDASVI